MKRNKTRSINIQAPAFMRGVLLIANCELRIANCELEMTLKEWDEIDLSTPELRQKCIEILICQKTQRDEDISQCLQVLEYLKNEAVEQKLQNVVLQEAKQKIAFIFWHKVSMIGVSLFGLFIPIH